MGKSLFSIKIFVCKFKNFLKKISISIGFLAQTRKDLSLGFLIAFRIIKDFH